MTQAKVVQYAGCGLTESDATDLRTCAVCAQRHPAPAEVAGRLLAYFGARCTSVRTPLDARQAREATLEVSATAVQLSRSNNFAPGSPPSLKVNVVTVLERD